MANLKDIKVRIDSVKKTRQITSAMKLVAGAKLRRATNTAMGARPYKEKLDAVLERVSAKAGDRIDDPLLKPHESVKRVALVILTSDRGLCGGFNNVLLRRTMDWLADQQAQGHEVDILVFGRKGVNFLQARKRAMTLKVVDYSRMPKMDLVKQASDFMIGGFLNETYDEAWIVFNQFVNAITQIPQFSRLVPMTLETKGEHGDHHGSDSNQVDYLYEPAPAELLGALLPLYLRTQILQAFFETEAGEHAARMTAMDNATRNASDLIKQLTLDYNRARQAAITSEIIEIVSGAEALNG